MSEFKEFGKIARLNRDVVITEKIDGTNAQILFEEIHTEQSCYALDTKDADGRTVAHAGCPGGRGGNMPVGDEVAVVRVTEEQAVARGWRAPGSGLFANHEHVYGVLAGSRSRWLVPNRDGAKTDNFGFGGWAAVNAQELFNLFGPGRVFGEWWGAGVQRKYGQATKRFSLFNVHKYGEVTSYLDPRCVTTAGTDGSGGELIVHKFHKGAKVCQCREARSALRSEVGGVLVDSVPVLYRGPWFGTMYIHDGLGAQPRTGWVPALALQKLAIEGSVAAPGYMGAEGIVVFHEAGGYLFKATLVGDEKPKGQP